MVVRATVAGAEIGFFHLPFVAIVTGRPSTKISLAAKLKRAIQSVRSVRRRQAAPGQATAPPPPGVTAAQFSGAWRRENTKLHHQSQGIHENAGLMDFAPR